MRFLMSVKDVHVLAGHSGDPSTLRKLNVAAVLRLLYAARADAEGDGDGRYTVTEIAQAVGISRPTAEDVVDALIAHRWLAEAAPKAGDGRRRAGRPARKIWFDAQAGCVVGIDLGPYSVRALVADLAGKVIGRAEYPMAEGVTAAEYVAAARTAVAEALRLAGRELGQVLAAAA